MQHVKSCRYCTDYKGDPKPIMPENLYRAKRMPDGSFKCYTCQTEELQLRIVRVTPNSQRTREIMVEEQREVSRYNDYVQRLDKSAGYNLMKLKKERYQ